MMSTHVEQYLVDYVEGTLDPSLAKEVADHLAECEQCAQELKEIQFLFEAFNKAEEVQPSETLRTNFYEMLEQEKQQQGKVVNLNNTNKRSWRYTWQIAASVALIVSSFFFGKYQQNQENLEQITELTTETKEVKQHMMLALVENESASKRVLGVNYIEELSEANTEILQALIKRMNYDENTNVRLAAVDALGKFPESDIARTALINALEFEAVPEVQIGIIQILGNFKEQRAAKPMEKLLEKEDVPAYVKDQIRLQLPNLA